jgi:arylsulfatase A
LPRITERAVKFLDRQARKEKRNPFFLYFALTAPHTPYLPSDRFVGQSRAGDYGDFVAMVDAAIGEILGALDRGRLTDETLVIMTSDNGARWTPEEIRQFGHRANFNNRGQKSDAFEGGHRIPFIVRWPGKVRAGSTSDELGCLVDLMATCAESAGVALPFNAAEDSFSLLPAILSKRLDRPIREAVVHHSGSGMFAIRSGQWKLILGLGSGGFTPPVRLVPKPGEPAGQLYDLARDRQETTNVYLQNPEVVRDLTSKLERIRQSGRSRSAG